MADFIKALLGFTKMSAVDLRTFAQRIYTSMKDNPAYPKPPVSMEELRLKIEALSECIVATMDGSRKAFADRDKQAAELIRMLQHNGYYVETACNGDETTFISSGYEMAKSTRTQTPPLNQSIRNLDYGENSGSFRFRFIAVDGADSYELRWAAQLADGTPGEWKWQPFGKTKGYITISGFTPGMTYRFQVRALIHMVWTDWSDPVTKIAM